MVRVRANEPMHGMLMVDARRRGGSVVRFDGSHPAGACGSLTCRVKVSGPMDSSG